MSQANVEIMHATFRAWNAGDMGALRALYDPDIIMRHPEGWPEPGPFVGREAVMRQFEQFRQTWDVNSVELIGDLIDVDDRVAVRARWRGAGHGPQWNIEMTNVVTVHNGKIITIQFFWNHGEALDALGPLEQDAHANS